MKNHDKRNSDPTGAKRLDKHQRISNRQNRVEPRANKRRSKRVALLTKPRQSAKLEMINAA